MLDLKVLTINKIYKNELWESSNFELISNRVFEQKTNRTKIK